MARELPALAKLSLHEEPEAEKMTAHDETSAVNVEEEAKPAVWRPRWRGNPDAKPTPYKPKAGQESMDAIKPGPGDYHSKAISEALHGEGHHSFMLKKNLLNESALPEDSGLDSAGNPREIVAIMYHRGSNPAPEQIAGDAKEIWTRYCHANIEASIGLPIPFFTYSASDRSYKLWKRKHSSFYIYAGMYEIESATLAKGQSPEVLAFLISREESQRERAPEIWKDKFESDWLKVRVVKCKPELQKPDPMLLSETANSDKTQ